jgi:hypothetical protein
MISSQMFLRLASASTQEVREDRDGNCHSLSASGIGHSPSSLYLGTEPMMNVGATCLMTQSQPRRGAKKCKRVILTSEQYR